MKSAGYIKGEESANLMIEKIELRPLKKSDAEVIAVRPSITHENVTLVRNAEVLRLETDSSGRAITSVVANVDGEEQRFSGSVVVVSAGAVNSAISNLGS